jgi:arylsulfatase A-like enzyme
MSTTHIDSASSVPERTKSWSKRLLHAIAWPYPSPGWAWVGLGAPATECLLLAGRSGGFLGMSELSWAERLACATLAFTSWALLTWILALSTRGLRFACRTEGQYRAAWLALGSGMAMLVVLYVGSWVVFLRNGIFADFDAFRFLAQNARMIGLYLVQAEGIAAAAVALVLATALLATYLTATRLPFQSGSYPPLSMRAAGLKIALISVLTADVAYLMTPAPADAKKKSAWWESQDVWRLDALRFRVNPLLSSFGGPFWKRNLPASSELTPDELGPLRSADETRAPVAATPTSRASVILVAVESLRHDVLMLKHQGREVMPNLNRLAATGLVFSRTYAQSSHSNYADPCLVSSLYPLRTTAEHYYSRTDPWPKVMLYDVLKQAGYATAIFSSQNEEWGNMHAFLESPHLDTFFDSRSYAGPTVTSRMDGGFANFAKGKRVAGKLDDATTIEQCSAWIRQQRAENRPFCIYVNLQTSHFPYQLPRGEGPFAPAQIDFHAAFDSYPKSKVEIVRNAYYNGLHYLDQQLGKLVQCLSESEGRDDTILAVVGDNGEAFYEHGHPTHAGPPFEQVIHVACVMNCPGLIPPATDDYLVQTIDLPPTLLGMLGRPSSPCFQGINVRAADRPAPDERLIFVHCHTFLAEMDSVITGGGWKLIENRRTGDVSLYDVDNDAEEAHDLAAGEQVIRQHLIELLGEWRRRQISYYANSKYFTLFYPPRTPQMSDAARAVLKPRNPRPTSR